MKFYLVIFLPILLVSFGSMLLETSVSEITTPNMAGTTVGSFAVSDAGAANYSIPLIYAPGTGGVEPSISINYSSQGGNGLMGLGWSIQGMSMIQRSGRTIAQDGFVKAPKFDAEDSYSLDGERMILVDGQFGVNGSEYRTEQNLHLEIVAQGNTPGFASPEWFRVRNKAGLIMEFGRTPDSRIEAQGTNTIVFWCISKIMDTKGNYMTFSYQENTSTGEYYPTRIDYTGNDEAGLAPYNSIIFEYADRPDNSPAYNSGSLISATKVLTAISCLHEGQLARSYKFEYEQGRYAKNLLLTRVQECGISTEDCLPPTVFTYQAENTLGYDVVNGSFIPDSHLEISESTLLQGDWNNDGLLDFMSHNIQNGEHHFYLNATDFDFVTIDGSINNEIVDQGFFQVLDVNSDGFSDLYWIDASSGGNDIFLNNGTEDLSFTLYPNPVPPSELETIQVDNPDFPGEGEFPFDFQFADTYLVDFNGDGQPDIVTYRRNTGRNRFYANRTGENNGVPTFELVSNSNIIPQATISTSYDDPNLSFFPIDWNSDGLIDFTWVNRNLNGTAGLRIFENTGDGIDLTFSAPISPGSINLKGGDGIKTGDWNGDGLTDLLWYRFGDSSVARWWINRGDNSFQPTASEAFVDNISDPEGKLFIVDFNSDRASDVIIYNQESGRNHWLLNDGKLNFSRPLNDDMPSQEGHVNLLPATAVQDGGNLITGNFYGNGGLDLLFLNLNVENNKTKFFRADIEPHFLLSEIENGQGLMHKIDYRPLIDEEVYEKESSATYPQADLISNMRVVCSFEVDDGIGGKSKVRYKYTGGKVDLHGRGFRGFTEIETVDETTGIVTTKFYEKDHRYIGAPLQRSETRLGTGQILKETELMDTLISYYGGKCFASFTVGSVTREYELSGDLVSSITNRSVFDDYGNVIYTVTDYGDGHIDSTLNVYDDNYQKWYLGRLVRTEAHRKAPGQPWVNRTAAFEYDNNSGLLTKEIIEPDFPAQEQIVKEYIHDSYGNITESRTTFYNGEAYETRIAFTSFDEKGRFTISRANQLGHEMTMTYDQVLGHLLSQTDANGLTVSYEYDPLGRPLATNYPDGTWERTSYQDCLDGSCPSLAVFKTVQSSSASPDVTTYFDVLGREVETNTLGFDGTTVLKHTQYNKRGLLSRVSSSHYEGEPPVWTEIAYDTLGREIATIALDGRVSQTIYQGLTTISINPEGQSMVTIKDAAGRIIQVKDNLDQVINYTYDSHGNLTHTTDPNGNQITVTYDHFGNKTSTSDPNMGTYHYVSNPIGELLRETTPAGDVTTYEYDLLGRTVSRQEPEGETQWVYDTQENGVGKLASITSPDYFYQLEYDSLSRMVHSVEQFAGESFSIDKSYDDQGRIATLTYPEEFTISYNYNEQNYLSEIRNYENNDLYWQANTMNGRGQLTSQTYGNGITTNMEYNDETFRLERIQGATANEENIIQDLSYAYNDLDILTQRINHLSGQTEDFTYDGLNRLLSSQIQGQNPLTMTYDGLGNITSKSDVGDFYYGENGAGPHQLTRVELTNADACLPSFTTDFTFTSYNMLSSMQNDSARLTIQYSASRNRTVQQQFLYGNLLETKYYVGAYFERTATSSSVRDRFYIHAPSGVVAVHNRLSSGEDNTIYWHKDHLGSVQTITDQAGDIVEVLDYDAWGNRRHNESSPNQDSTVYQSDRGFTGHEHLDLFGLINMNGRVYDPELARFISPDSFLIEPYNLQNYNRYAYVHNNPLAYTDPSGFFLDKIGDEIERGVRRVRDRVLSGDPAEWVKLSSGFGYNPLFNWAVDELDRRGAKIFGQDNWNTIKVTATTIAIAAATGGSGGFLQAVFSGAVSGFAGAYTSVSLAGGTINQAFKAGLTGAGVGAGTAALTFGIGTGADYAFGGNKGAFAAAMKTNPYAAKTLAVYGVKVISHGVVQGLASDVSGGKFEHGFWSGAFTAGAEAFTPDGFYSGLATSAAVGGTGSLIGGGKFSNGAISGAMVFLYNNNAHKEAQRKAREKEALGLARDIFGVTADGFEMGARYSTDHEKLFTGFARYKGAKALTMTGFLDGGDGLFWSGLEIATEFTFKAARLAGTAASVILMVLEPSSIADATLKDYQRNPPHLYLRPEYR